MKPILFSTPMVQAILDGRKKITRRVIKKIPDGTHDIWHDGAQWIVQNKFHDCWVKFFKCPYGNIGDILWVRETWQYVNLGPEDENNGYVYKASENGQEWAANDEEWTWKPSIFMPKDACRIFLKITNIRAERLQEISSEDAINEGVEFMEDHISLGFKLYGNHNIPDMFGRKAKTGTAYESFKTLWQSINGNESWENNTWVWVIKFEPTDKPESI